MRVNASLLASALLCSVSCFAAGTYKVSTSVYVKGELLASPTMTVEADKVASITIDNDVRYNFTIKPNQDNTAGVIATVTVGGETIRPSLVVAYEEEAIVEIGSQKLTLLVSKVSS
ncbi:hypothetical protein [Pseudoalteromonas sp. MMG022]|uniref:hypothetical protein n=1 Tax=Pseudoalteromonas sp. MMG022 TaxID=2909978 RepID=UPI001F230A67|nr:hypothetical protein [Pseudoalteromonas sp. MMG022]MCF6435849.1 hypothetical protein [Pseudoalteromonas sp. MMG022]